MKRVAFMGGKGGVGKTTVAVSAAKALSGAGYGVSLADFDVTGANAHLFLDILQDYEVAGERIIPARAKIDGRPVRFLSLALVSDSFVGFKDEIPGKFVEQVTLQTDWGDSDYLVIDAPPGTHGDARKIAELADVVVLVAIGGKLGALDLRRTVEMLRGHRKPIAGAYVNFSKYTCECGRSVPLFGEPELEVPVIEEIPFLGRSPKEGRPPLPELDAGRLVHHLSNPVVLPERPKRTLKGRLVEALLRTVGA